MIERIIDASIRCRWQVIGAALALALLGLYAVEHTPVDAIPDLSENQVIVFADWSGHGPREIEDQLTYPLSRALQGLDGVRVVRSSSDFNFSMLSLIFEERVDVRVARQSVGQALSAANRLLPSGVTAYLAPESPATGQIFWYTIEGEGQDLSRLRAIQDWYVRGQLERRAGRGRSGQRRRGAARIPDRRRPATTSTIRAGPARGVGRNRPLQRRHRRPCPAARRVRVYRPGAQRRRRRR